MRRPSPDSPRRLFTRVQVYYRPATSNNPGREWLALCKIGHCRRRTWWGFFDTMDKAMTSARSHITEHRSVVD